VIRKRGSGLQVQVYAGRDPFTGRKRWVSRQVPGQTKAAYRQAKKVEAELLEQVDRGEQRGSRTRTVAELVERWFTWRQQVKPISPVTVANYRGAIDRYVLPALGRAKLREVDAATLDALYAQVRAHGGRCRACWTGIRRGEPPLRAGERDRPSVSASEGPSSLVAAPLQRTKPAWAALAWCGGQVTSSASAAGPTRRRGIGWPARWLTDCSLSCARARSWLRCCLPVLQEVAVPPPPSPIGLCPLPAPAGRDPPKRR
jgi:Phage integrase, N-terminal SAM-like domain